ncbi:Delta(3,5)-Delta(2,4)-dienoyl-CoA isomerase [Cyphellophora attinorum]|uniref:Delta(3,5)-Delta(2,4)-dienoyl-CoA isomerase n=1 Tax=Cyphellophora attinorum TaxID=1664694 RepID=A0A0N1H2W8_9EURO|nr:Delta(3,5)-Delta(2,4)-dienoyl-CoA isomerase [Phialophora attinorum]KPI35724.1 Delta(3,5)-Delta(2,4)-dienoyl-CoA isomerase [Phialophora attinorum]
MASGRCRDAVPLEYRGKIAIITLDKPKKLNALTKDEFYHLSRTLAEVARQDAVVATVLTGNGRFFSAGADVSVSRQSPPGTDVYRQHLTTTVASNLNLARAFYTHPKILVVALNGPVVGMCAAVIAFADFIYCVPQTYLLTPFASLGLISEGVSSIAFADRMGISKANEALIWGKRISSSELLATGFVNEILDCGQDAFREKVLDEVTQRFHDGLNHSSMLQIKDTIRKRQRRELDAQAVDEVFGALERNVQGIPQKEFEKLRRGQKKHKL